MVRGRGFPNDRTFGVTHGGSEFDHKNPAWIGRRNFLVVAYSPMLAGLECSYSTDGQSIQLTQGSCVNWYDLTIEADRDLLAGALGNFAGAKQTGPYKIVQAEGVNLTDSETQTVSLFNTQSLRQLQSAVRRTLDQRRFRGNIWLRFEEAWSEFDLVGKTITIGQVRLRITERIERCAAINASPETGEQDIELARLIRDTYGHSDFGVLAHVETGGSVQVGDPVR